MRLPALLLAMAVAGVAGYLLGRSGGEGGRAGRVPERMDSVPARAARMRAEEAAAVQDRLVEELAEENRRLREEVARLRPPEELPVGARRDDGTIVGGARWSDTFLAMAVGFLETMFRQLTAEADLAPDQERRLRDQMNARFTRALGISAAFTNGDMEGDEVYTRLAALAEDTRRMVATLLDDRQMEIYRRFDRGITEFMQHQVIENEMQTFKAELALDEEQERALRALVEERYGRVTQGLTSPLPSVMFKPIRRAQDRAIYEETAAAMRSLLRPEQRAAFDRIEAAAPEAPFAYRAMLVPDSG